jgi:hypothetical protein
VIWLWFSRMESKAAEFIRAHVIEWAFWMTVWSKSTRAIQMRETKKHRNSPSFSWEMLFTYENEFESTRCISSENSFKSTYCALFRVHERDNNESRVHSIWAKDFVCFGCCQWWKTDC